MAKKKVTLDELEQIPREYLLASDIAPLIDGGVATILYYAKNKPDLLGFPVVVTGKLVRIPKQAFVFFWRYGRATIDYNLLALAVADIERKRRGEDKVAI